MEKTQAMENPKTAWYGWGPFPKKKTRVEKSRGTGNTSKRLGQTGKNGRGLFLKRTRGENPAMKNPKSAWSKRRRRMEPLPKTKHAWRNGENPRQQGTPQNGLVKAGNTDGASSLKKKKNVEKNPGQRGTPQNDLVKAGKTDRASS